MARPDRKDADYFPFYAKNGKTLHLLQHRFQLAGIGFFTNLMRLLTTTPDHHIAIESDADEAYFFSMIGCDTEDGIAMIETMALTGKIHKRLWEEAKIIVSPDLIESLTDAYAKRKNEIITIEELENKHLPEIANEDIESFRGQKPISSRVSGSGNPQARVVSGQNQTPKPTKERKGKERILDIPESPEGDPVSGTELSVSKRKPAPLKDELAAQYEQAFTHEVPLEAWKSIPQERKHLVEIAKRTRRSLSVTPYDTSEELAGAIMAEFAEQRRTGKGDYWRKAPFTPSSLTARWDQVIEGLRQRFDSAPVEDEFYEQYGF